MQLQAAGPFPWQHAQNNSIDRQRIAPGMVPVLPIIVHRSRHDDYMCAHRADRLILLIEALVAIMQQRCRRPQHDPFETDYLLLGEPVELEIDKPLVDVLDVLVVVDLVCNILEH